MMGPTNERATHMISCFLAGVFIVFAFGLFGEVVREVRDAYSQATEATEATQPDGSLLVEPALSVTLDQGSQG